MRLRSLGSPLPSQCGEALCVLRPIMEGLRIKVGTVRPDQRVHLGIDTHLLEDGGVTQGLKELAGQDGLEVDCLFGRIIESNTQGVRANDLERLDTVDSVRHASFPTTVEQSVGASGRACGSPTTLPLASSTHSLDLVSRLWYRPICEETAETSGHQGCIAAARSPICGLPG